MGPFGLHDQFMEYTTILVGFILSLEIGTHVKTPCQRRGISGSALPLGVSQPRPPAPTERPATPCSPGSPGFSLCTGLRLAVPFPPVRPTGPEFPWLVVAIEHRPTRLVGHQRRAGPDQPSPPRKPSQAWGVEVANFVGPTSIHARSPCATRSRRASLSGNGSAQASISTSVSMKP